VRGEGGGPKVKITTMHLEAYAWWKAKQAMGSYKTKAHELGITSACLYSMIRRMRDRDKESKAPTRKFIKSLKECPF
jgi:hypothetical protein